MEDLFYIYGKLSFKVCLYRTRPRLGGDRKGMIYIKQTKVVYIERERETRL